jgi:predicted permease
MSGDESRDRARRVELPPSHQSVERDIDDELAFHIAMRAERLKRGGLVTDEARVEARRRFGDVERVRGELRRIDHERVRRARLAGWLEDLARDLVLAARALRRAPGFTIVALSTLALGIGATTAIFSIVYAVLLKPLPFPAADRLVEISVTEAGLGLERMGLSEPELGDVERMGGSLAAVGAYDTDVGTLTGTGSPERLKLGVATAGFFRALAIRPEVGRFIAPAENRPGSNRVIVLGHALWERRFGGDPHVVGSTVRLDGVSRTVLGVLPTEMRLPAVDAYVPLVIDPANPRPRGSHFLELVARLAPGASIERAAAELATLTARLHSTYPEHYVNARLALDVRPLRESWLGESRPTLLALLAAVGLLLLLACANTTNLLLIRAEVRRREIAVRVAIGASRGRVVRQLLAESLLLAVVGAALGIPVALLGGSALLAAASGAVPAGVTIGPDPVVALGAIAVTLLTAMLTGLVPAVQGAAFDVRSAIATGGVGGGRRGGRLRSILVATEIGIATMVLVAAALVGRSFWRLQSVDPGFVREGVLAFDLSLAPARYPKLAEVTGTYARILGELRALPGVRFAGLTSTVPLGGPGGDWVIEVEGRPPRPGAPLPSPDFTVVSEGYFETMRIPLRAGRTFARADGPSTRPVVVIAAALAREIFADADPIGARIRVSAGPGNAPNPWMDVIGVVGDVRSHDLGRAARPAYYLLDVQLPALVGGAMHDVTALVRTDGEPRALAAASRRIVHAIDPEVAVANVRTMDDVVSGAVARPRFAATVLAGFGIASLALAVIGAYGVLSYAMTRRRREIGIRLALGARAGAVRRMVLGEAARVAMVGVAIGIAASAALARVLGALLFDVRAADPATFALAALVLIVAALAAAYLPARRATRVQPMEVLKVD